MHTINALPRRTVPYLSFNDFLATYGEDRLNRIVDRYHAVEARNGKAIAAEQITEFFDIKQEILDSAITYVTKQEGRRIPLNGQIKDLEAEVREGHTSTVTPLERARNYGAQKTNEYVKPADVIPITRDKRYPAATNQAGIRVSQRVPQKLSRSYRHWGAIAAVSLAGLTYLANPFSGLFGQTSPAYAQQAQPTSVDAHRKYLEWVKSRVQEALEKGQAPSQKGAAPAPGQSPAVPPKVAAPVTPAPTLQDLQGKLDDLGQKYSTLNKNYTDFREAVGSLRKDYETHKASLGAGADEFGNKLTALEAKVAKLAGQDAPPAAPATAPPKTWEELAALHATYKPGWQQRGPWHEPFIKGETKYKDLPPEGQKWFGLGNPTTKIEDLQDKCLVTIKIPTRYSGSDLPQHYMGAKLPGKGWVFALPPSRETGLTFSKEQCATLKASDKPVLQWGMYEPKDVRFWVSSVNKEKVRAPAKPVAELPPRADKVEAPPVPRAVEAPPIVVAPAAPKEDVGGTPYETKHRTH